MIFHVEGNKVTNEYASGRSSNHGVTQVLQEHGPTEILAMLKRMWPKNPEKRIITSILIYGVACSW